MNTLYATKPEMCSKVLEDPMMTSIYEPAKPDPAKGRPEEVLDIHLFVSS